MPPFLKYEFGVMSKTHSRSQSKYMVGNGPPKPPCWRDFLPETCKSSVITFKNSVKQACGSDVNRGKPLGKSTAVQGQFTNLNVINLSKSISEPCKQSKPLDLAVSQYNHTTIVSYSHNNNNNNSRSSPNKASHPKKSRLQALKRVRSKLRRTQSQAAIDTADLPDLTDLTISLAETRPKEFGLCRSAPFDARVYLDANAKRCEEWLEEVRAAGPAVMSDVDFGEGSGDELEIPEETWHDFKDLKKRHRSGLPHGHRKCNLKKASTVKERHQLVDYTDQHRCKLKCEQDGS